MNVASREILQCTFKLRFMDDSFTSAKTVLIAFILSTAVLVWFFTFIHKKEQKHSGPGSIYSKVKI